LHPERSSGLHHLGSVPGVRWTKGRHKADLYPPLLSNLVLDEMDRELERRGLRFARYADDGNIYVRSRRAGERVMERITRFITTKLKLKVNQQKSAVAQPWEREFLGFSFTHFGPLKRRIAPKAIGRFKERVRELAEVCHEGQIFDYF